VTKEPSDELSRFSLAVQQSWRLFHL